MLVSARALTVLVVAHNDSQKLLATIDRIYNALTVTVEDFSILIFDDGSTDDTLAVAEASVKVGGAGHNLCGRPMSRFLCNGCAAMTPQLCFA